MPRQASPTQCAAEDSSIRQSCHLGRDPALRKWPSLLVSDCTIHLEVKGQGPIGEENQQKEEGKKL